MINLDPTRAPENYELTVTRVYLNILQLYNLFLFLEYLCPKVYRGGLTLGICYKMGDYGYRRCVIFEIRMPKPLGKP